MLSRNGFPPEDDSMEIGWKAHLEDSSRRRRHLRECVDISPILLLLVPKLNFGGQSMM